MQIRPLSFIYICTVRSSYSIAFYSHYWVIYLQLQHINLNLNKIFRTNYYGKFNMASSILLFMCKFNQNLLHDESTEKCYKYPHDLEHYYANFQSGLRYGIMFWGGDKKCTKIFRLQIKVIRLITGTHKRESCRPTFRRFQILTLA